MIEDSLLDVHIFSVLEVTTGVSSGDWETCFESVLILL